jgi:2-(1,2-epoxy-1,2-dihydrophenyl)acetyl-CoA isomerase
MKYETLTIEHKNKIAYITLSRPERLNSFDIKLGSELYDALKKITKDDSIRAVVIKGTGKGFCGGGDVKEMYNAENKTEFLRKLTKVIHKCVIEMRTMEKPVIAEVNGAAFGAGLSIALACDIIIASKEAKFGTAFIGIGLAPGCGTQFFTKLVGYQRE